MAWIEAVALLLIAVYVVMRIAMRFLFPPEKGSRSSRHNRAED